MTDANSNALRHFEARFIASLYRVYAEVPEEIADKAIGDVLGQLVDKLRSRDRP